MPSETKKRTDPMIGRTLNETYLLERLIGRGGMGRVYAGRHLRLSRPVAVKVLQSKFSSSPDAVERFRHEARSASALGHPNIVQVFDFNQSEDRSWYIVMELLEGEDLRSVIKREKQIEPAACLPVLQQLCDALDLAHSKGLVHRDLKPSNIFLRALQGRSEVKILDFGVAKILGADLGLTMDGAMLGTPHYMAPEQAAGEGSLTPRVDIYALGTVLFEMLTGRRPFDAESPLTVLHLRATQNPPDPSSIVSTLPKELDGVIRRALERDPAARFESPAELVLAFQKALPPEVSQHPLTTIEVQGSEPRDEASGQSDTKLSSPVVPEEESHSGETVLASMNTATSTSGSQTSSSVIQLKSSDELRMATIMVVTVGPTDSDEADPDEILDLTASLLGRLAEKIADYGGTIEQDIGDALVTVFGVPSATGDDPVQSVRAGLAASEIGRSQSEQGIETRVGIQTGRILRRSGRTGVTGDVVKVATRLADECPAGEVLVGHQTYLHIRGRFDVSFRDQLKVRGQRQPLRTYRVTGERDYGVVLEPRGGLGQEAKLVGREAEREYLKGLYFRAAHESQAQAILILGGPGVGKTRLAHELISTLDEQSERFGYFPARASDLAAPIPYGLLGELIRIKLSTRTVAPEEAALKLTELISWPFSPAATGSVTGSTTIAFKPALPPIEIARTIGAAIGCQLDDDTNYQQETSPDKLAVAISAYMSAVARSHPVIIALDDIHRSDDESIELVELIMRQSEDVPVVFLGFARPDFIESHPSFLAGFEHLTTITLHSLSATAVTAQVNALLGGLAPAGLGPAIHKRSGGNPLLVEEMVRALRDTGELCQDEGDGPWVFLGDLENLDVPSRAETLLQARLDQLAKPDRELLRCAAVIGATFWEGALADLGLERVEARLDVLEQTDLIRLRPASRFSATRQWAFKSELLAEVARGNVPARDRRQIHQAMADWLGRQDQRDPDTLSLRAHHLTLAGLRAAALDLLGEAGRLAERQMRWQAALASFTQAYELALSEGDEASSLYYATHVGRLGVRAHLPGKCIDVLERGSAQASEAGDEVMEANLLQLLGRSLAIQGSYERARDVTERAHTLAEKRGDLRLKFETSKALGFVFYYGDAFDEAATAFERCIDAARELKDDEEVAINIYNVADSSLAAGDWKRALEFADRAEAACAGREKVAFLRQSALGISNFVRARYQDDDDARAALEQWIAYADEHGYVDQQLDARFYLAKVLKHQGRLKEALPVARTGLELAVDAHSEQTERKMSTLIESLQSSGERPQSDEQEPHESGKPSE